MFKNLDLIQVFLDALNYFFICITLLITVVVIAFYVLTGVLESIKPRQLFAQYQYLKVKHSTTVESGTARSNIERDNFSKVTFGLRYSF